ncbi:hypothetical protein BKA61DRAFT_625796 [Leptodontidium sp. MPI-SDFR-AT-0119]|nr:hypothetical protein BKA61DRAFT_625796 [Leptodontidium sp. MPI-SDFR-AT-0119]
MVIFDTIDTAPMDDYNYSPISANQIRLLLLCDHSFCRLSPAAVVSKTHGVWLGEASYDSDDAINFLLFLCTIGFWSQRQSDRLKAAEIADRSGKYQVQWNAVQSLFRRPWWNRVWTVQEQIVSRNQTFFCGQAHIDQQELYWAIRGIYKCHATTGLLDFGSQWSRIRLLELRDCSPGVGSCNHPRQSLIATIAYLADHDATDPRDRLFSVSGLVRDFLLCGRPSYVIRVETLYTDLVRAFIKEYNSLDIICFATIFRASIDGTSTLPSWVPDWRIKLTPLVVPLMVSQGAKEYIGNLRPCNYSGFSACYSASLDISPEIAYSPDHLKMTCTGLSVTSIEGLTKFPQTLFHDGEKEELNSLPLTAYQELPMDASQLVESILRCLVLNRGDHYLNHLAPIQRYLEQFRIIVSEAMKDKLKVPPWFADWLEVNSDFLFGVVRLRKLLDAIVDSKEIEEGRLPDLKDRRGFLARFYDTMVRMQRKLVLCKNGRLATVPWRAQKADVICVLFGCSVPVVLRELENEVFEFVGECYVDGYMDGEAIGKAKERQFVIK